MYDCTKIGWAQGRSGRVRKISPLPQGFDLRTAQPVVSPYIDYAVDLLNAIILHFLNLPAFMMPHLQAKIVVLTPLLCQH
jgi:hypothetical protein